MDKLLRTFAKAISLLRKNQFAALEELLTKNPSLRSYHFKDRSLIWDAYFSSEESVRKLLTIGVNPDVCDTAGGRILSAYAASNNHEMVKLLLEQGSDPNTPELNGETPFSWACFKDAFECAKLLYQFGADVNAQIGSGGGFPLDWAENQASPAFLNWLKSVGARSGYS